jgi:hypothetical protein
MIAIKLTGLDELITNFAQHPQIVESAVKKALGLSLSETEHQTKVRVPVETGYLQGSIGGEGGYSFVRGLTAGIGTNVQYAIYVESNTNARHRTGQARFMEDGVQAAMPFVQKSFEDAMEDIAKQLTK